MSTESKHSGSVWCEHCRDHFPEYHYDDEGSHRVGYEWGPTGSKSQHIRDLEEQLEAQRELIEEAHRFALVLAELKVKTRPFAEAWLDKYRAAYPAREPS